LDDITIFSASDQEHLQHLRQVFVKCRKYGISLNLKKSHFGPKEGKMLGDIVSKNGVRIDPKRVIEIQDLTLPRSKKEIQSFLDKVNFLRRLIPNFAEVVKHITCMVRKDKEIKWTVESRNSFELIKKAIIEAPQLVSLEYSKPFLMFSFSSQDTIVVIFLQYNSENKEASITFFSRDLTDGELRYEMLEKHAYALVKALKAFRVYILHA